MESNEGKIKSKYQSEQKMYVNDKESEGISTFLSVLAWMIFIGGFIGGIIVANREREIEGWYYDEVENTLIGA